MSAKLTKKLIERYWRDHPQIFFCGFQSKDIDALPFADDPRHWIRIVLHAVEELHTRGYKYIYLILDDQGPLDLCHAVHLNKTIPAWMDELGASYISIRGWDHRRHSSGPNLGRAYLWLQHQSEGYLWRWALHPALWRTVVLAEILRRLAVEASNDQDLSAWAFEIRAGKLRDLAVSSWNKSTYRVCGRSMSLQRQAPIVQKFKHYRDRWVRMLDRATHGEDFLASRLPAILRRPLTFMLRTQAVFYEGPYPIYFSGFMKAGRINRHVLRYLSRRGRNDLLQEIASTFSQEQ